MTEIEALSIRVATLQALVEHMSKIVERQGSTVYQLADSTFGEYEAGSAPSINEKIGRCVARLDKLTARVTAVEDGLAAWVAS